MIIICKLKRYNYNRKRIGNGCLRLCIKQKQGTLEVIYRVLTCLQHFILI